MHGVREIAASRSASELMTDEQLGEGSLTLEALAEPAVDLLERAAEFFGAEGCGQPFYDGTLAHPLNDD